MNINTGEKYHIGYAWDDGPTDSFTSLEEALQVANEWRNENPKGAEIYVWELLKVI